MRNRLLELSLNLAIAAAALGMTNASHAVELDSKAVAYVAPDQFKWRDPTDQAATNQTILLAIQARREAFTSRSTNSRPTAWATRTITRTTATS
jgi:hypothetical protein